MKSLNPHWRTLALSTALVICTAPALGFDAADEADRLNSQALRLQEQGHYREAIAVAERALAIREVLAPEDPVTAIILDNLGNYYHDAGEYAKAESVILRALSIFENKLGPEDPDTATCLNNLAQLYKSTGAYAKAEPLYERALKIREKVLGPEHPETVVTLNNLGELYYITGANTKAERAYVRVLEIRTKTLGLEHRDTALTLNDLGILYIDARAYATAEKLLLSALAIRRKLLGDEHPQTVQSLNNLASLYFANTEYAKAEPLYVRALAIREKVLGPEHTGTARSLNGLGNLYHATREYAKAEPLYSRSLAIREKTAGSDHPMTALGLDNLASLHWSAGDLALALPLLERAREIKELNVARLLQSGTEERRSQYLATLGHDVDVSYSLIDPAPGAHALGASAVLQLKGRVLDATTDLVARVRHHLDEEGRAQLDELQSVVAKRSQLSLIGPGPLNAQVWRQRLNELAREQDLLEGSLARRSGEFQQGIEPVTLQRVQAALGARDVLVEWTRFSPINPKGRPNKDRFGAPRYAAYLITHSQTPMVVDLGEATAIERAVAQLQNVLRSPGSDPRPQEARRVFELAVRPLLVPLRQLQPNPTRLLLSPDGALHLIPFAALLDEQGRYLGQRWELSYLTSGRDLLRLDGNTVPRSGVTVLADPDFDQVGQASASQRSTSSGQRAADLDRSSMVFSALPGTAGEAKLLKRLFTLPPAQVATGAAASEARVKHLVGPSILHIATHGFFLRDLPEVDYDGPGSHRARSPRGEVESDEGADASQPRPGVGENPLLRSGLALAGANARRADGGEDGILTAAEAAQLDLQGTQLVVLSACETGAGGVVNGEGVYGLRRALVLAGAKSQLVSLWKVNDIATEQLMGEYYRHLKQGEGRAQALRSAQTMLRSNLATAHPYYWAPFIPVGDWRPITKW